MQSLMLVDLRTSVTRRPAIWLATKNFYFWAINIIIPSGDSNLGPKAFSLLEYEIAP